MLLIDSDFYLFFKPQIAGLIAKTAFIKISAIYTNFVDIFSPNLAFKLFRHTGINNHIIELENSQQLSYKPLYSLGLVELETLKAYIKTNLVNGFIKPSKLAADTPIFFD